MLGRGMRVAYGKRDCLVLDLIGNLARLGAVGVIPEWADRRPPADRRTPSNNCTVRQDLIIAILKPVKDLLYPLINDASHGSIQF
jgi:hypothetical protein